MNRHIAKIMADACLIADRMQRHGFTHVPVDMCSEYVFLGEIAFELFTRCYAPDNAIKSRLASDHAKQVALVAHSIIVSNRKIER